MAIDPVCKMNVEPNKATAKVDYAGQVYYFCSAACHKAFIAEPQKYAGSTSHGGHFSDFRADGRYGETARQDAM